MIAARPRYSLPRAQKTPHYRPQGARATVNRLAARAGVASVGCVAGSERLDAVPEVLDQLSGEPELGQLLARALIYRHVTEIIRRAGTPGLGLVARAGQPVTELILARLTR